MAAEGETGEKTEQPSGRRMAKAREDGMVARSQDLSMLTHITTAYLLLQYLSPSIWHNLELLFTYCFQYELSSDPLSPQSLREKLIRVMLLLGGDVLLLIFITALVGSLTTALQTNFLWSSKLLRPKFSQLNPISGIKRLMSTRNIVNLIKSILKLAVISPIAYFAFMEYFPQIISLMSINITQMMPFVSEAASTVFWRITSFLLALSIVDFAWEKYKNKRELMMTKQEAKEERKSIEGDEHTKATIRSRGFSRIRQRMMQDVAKADVVVTNPTHYAIALRYDPQTHPAPLVLAKGKDHLAQKIKELARINNVPCVERKPLAQALYKSTEVGQQIPYELFTAVAEILAYVYKLRGKNPLNRKQVPVETPIAEIELPASPYISLEDNRNYEF